MTCTYVQSPWTQIQDRHFILRCRTRVPTMPHYLLIFDRYWVKLAGETADDLHQAKHVWV